MEHFLAAQQRDDSEQPQQPRFWDDAWRDRTDPFDFRNWPQQATEQPLEAATLEERAWVFLNAADTNARAGVAITPQSVAECIEQGAHIVRSGIGLDFLPSWLLSADDVEMMARYGRWTRTLPDGARVELDELIGDVEAKNQ